MRLPWWPIYIDARMDEHGASYETPDRVSHYAPWHRLTASQGPRVKNWFNILDADLKRERHQGAPIVLRFPQAIPNALTLQANFLAQSEYELKVTDKASKESRIVPVFMPLWLSLAMAMPLVMVLATDLPPVPENEFGKRFEIAATLLFSAAIFCCVLLVGIAIRNRRRYGRMPTLRAITRQTITISDSHNNEIVLPQARLSEARSSWGAHTITTHDGSHILLPHASSVRRLIRGSSLRHPHQDISVKFAVCVSLMSLAFGPIVYFWTRYLTPDDPIAPTLGACVAASFLGLGFMLFLMAAIRFTNRVEKHRKAKSQ